MKIPRQKAVLRLEVGNVWTRAMAGPNLLKLIDDELTFDVPGSWFSPRFQKRQWDGKKHFVKKTQDSTSVLFQTGILPYLINVLPSSQIAVKILDLRLLPFDLEKLELRKRRPYITEDRWLDDLKYVNFSPDPRKIKYQVEAINSCLHNCFLTHHWPRGIVASAVASGKAAMIAGFIKTLRLPVLFTAHRLDLLRQIRKTFSEILPPEDVGQIGGGKLEFGKRYTVSSIQTLSKRMKEPVFKDFLGNVKVWIVDEAHMVGDNAYYKVSNAMPRAYYRLGFTGTAFKKSEITDMYARSIFGSEIYSLRSKKLINDGLTTRPIINLVKGEFSVPSVLPPHATPHELYDEQITHNEHRNSVICRLAVDDLKAGRRPVILVSRVAHGKILQTLLSPYWKCLFVSGDDPPDDRSEVYASFEDKSLNILIVSGIFDMGIDIPCIDTIILAGAGKDPSRMVQRVGRGVRVSEGKTHCMVYDFDDQTHPFDSQVASRMQACSDEGWEIVVRELV